MTHIKCLLLALTLAAAPAWACTPESEFDCDLFSRSCQRINSESCAKKNFGEGENTKYGSEVDCLAQNGVNGFVIAPARAKAKDETQAPYGFSFKCYGADVTRVDGSFDDCVG